VLATANPVDDAQGGYVIKDWDIALQPEIASKMVSYDGQSTNASESLDLSFLLHHVPSLETVTAPTCDPLQTCKGGLLLNPDTCMCECPGRGHCPDGSTWDDASSTCVLHCAQGGTIAGYACVYQGTVETNTVGTDGTVGPAESATVTFTATNMQGCAIDYTPTGTATYSPAPKGGCSYAPTTVAMSASNTSGTMIIGLSPPTLVLDFTTLIDGTMTCNNASVQTEYGWVWAEVLNGPVAPGGPLTGQATTMAGTAVVTTTWSLTPQ